MSSPDSVGSFVEPGARLEKLAGGFQFTEGPVWMNSEQALYFSDIPASITRRWSERRGVETMRAPNDKSNGMFLDHDGGLLVCQHGRRRIVKWRGGAEVEVVVDSFHGKKFNSPNDLVVRRDGALYFTDPPYGLTAAFGEPGQQELDFQGVFRTDPARRQVLLLNKGFFRPNGLAFSPDQQRLYVNDSEELLIRVFDVNAAGDLANERLFAEVRGDAPGCPDGMKVDTQGNVYVTGPGGLWVFSPAGERIGFLPVPEVIGNFAFGEADRRTIFLTASTSLYRIRVLTPGI
jgi:gluconolactonase